MFMQVWTSVGCWFWLVEAYAAFPSDGDLLLGTAAATSPAAVGSGASASACSSGRGPKRCHPVLPTFHAALGKATNTKRKPSEGPNSSSAFQLASNPFAPIKSQLQAAPVCVFPLATKATSLSICLCGLG